MKTFEVFLYAKSTDEIPVEIHIIEAENYIDIIAKVNKLVEGSNYFYSYEEVLIEGK